MSFRGSGEGGGRRRERKAGRKKNGSGKERTKVRTDVASVSECAGKVVEEVFGEDGRHYII